MKLSQLIHEVWKDDRVKALKIRKSEIKIIVEVIIEKIGKGLINNKLVKLRGLFTLELRKVKGRKISNIKDGEEIFIDSYYKVGVIPSADMKDKLSEIKD